ncbi:hypothetical protein NPIL_24881, partial [Nephila pilipes]
TNQVCWALIYTRRATCWPGLSFDWQLVVLGGKGLGGDLLISRVPYSDFIFKKLNLRWKKGRQRTKFFLQMTSISPQPSQRENVDLKCISLFIMELGLQHVARLKHCLPYA